MMYYVTGDDEFAEFDTPVEEILAELDTGEPVSFASGLSITTSTLPPVSHTAAAGEATKLKLPA
jgi:hypothetical protein